MTTQRTTANELGCTKNHFNAVLNARARASFDLAERMAELFGGEERDYIKKDKSMIRIRKARYLRYKAQRAMENAEG